MTQGNPVALQRTLDSFRPFCDEVILGDLCVFPEDRATIADYAQLYNLHLVKLPFNFIFQHGFSSVLNTLSSYASNDFVLYMNVGEVIDERHPVSFQPGEENSYFFIHAVEKHHWYRLYNRHQMEWGNRIHEELRSKRPFSPIPRLTPSFMMRDTEKDIEDPFKSKVYNDVKELVYFQQYIQLVEDPETREGTNQGWVDYAIDAHESLTTRMALKGKRYEAFLKGDYDMYMNDIRTNPEFEKERMISSELINFQGDRKLL